MTIRSSSQVEVFGVFDIETRPDPLALTLLRQREGSRVPAALHQVTAAAMLVGHEGAEGGWTDLRLASLTEPEHSERSIILGVDEFLTELSDQAGTCVTFNGLTHDLPTLRRRAARHQLFDTPGIHPAEPIRHTDLMRRCTRGWRDDWPSLRAACAGLGIPVNHMLSEQRGPGVPAPQRKCETDAVCTFLLMLYELSMARRDGTTLENGWNALAKLLGTNRQPHLAQFARGLTLKRSAAVRTATPVCTIASAASSETNSAGPSQFASSSKSAS